jgi:hypothetical protein
LSGSTQGPSQLATDLFAANSSYDNYPPLIPVQTMNWGILAKEHAVHPPHVDRAGTCTWGLIEDGIKKWDLSLPPDEVADEEAANPSRYGQSMMSNRNHDGKWRLLSVLLEAGDMM